MKKSIFSIAVLCASLIFAAQAQAKEVRIALVVKALGIGFFEAADKGAQEAAKELGNTKIIYTGPTTTTAEGQIEIINSLIAQHVDAIAISANDSDALVPVLKRAMARGIKVVSWDSGVAQPGRMLQINDASSQLIGKVCDQLAMDAIKAKGKKSGTFAILSATPTSTNQNTWINWMKKSLKQFPNLKLVDTVYGNDLADKSFREARALIKNHPNLDVIVAPTTVGILAAAQAVTDMGLQGKVYVTGLGLPSQLAGHVHSGVIHSFAIWNPIDLGYTAIMASYDLVTSKGSKTRLSVGRMGVLKVDQNGDTDMGKPFIYNASNVDKYASMF